jgi:hypothetical protein
MKYALIKKNKVELISYEPIEGYIEVSDNVFADMIRKPDGSFDYSDEFKLEHIKIETYKDKRAKEYPSIQEQLDMQYWDKINGTNNWQDAINAVKTKYPKGN